MEVRNHASFLVGTMSGDHERRKNTSPVGWIEATYVLRFVEWAEPLNDDPDWKFQSWGNAILIKARDLDEA